MMIRIEKRERRGRVAVNKTNTEPRTAARSAMAFIALAAPNLIHAAPNFSNLFKKFSRFVFFFSRPLLQCIHSDRSVSLTKPWRWAVFAEPIQRLKASRRERGGCNLLQYRPGSPSQSAHGLAQKRSERLLSTTMCHSCLISFQRLQHLVDCNHCAMTRHIQQKFLPGECWHTRPDKEKRRFAKGRVKERGEERVNAKAIWRPHKGKAEEWERKAAKDVVLWQIIGTE